MDYTVYTISTITRITTKFVVCVLEQPGVHHIHYNKDYNIDSFLINRVPGVHHIHYNKDYNKLSE